MARMLVDIHVDKTVINRLAGGMTPRRLCEVLRHMNVVEMMMAMQKMRERSTPSNQCHVTNLRDNPVQIACDAAEAALRGFAETETTVGHRPVRAAVRPRGCWSDPSAAAPACSPSARWRRPPS